MMETLRGVAVLEAAGFNGPGAGLLRSWADGTWLSWRAPGSANDGSPVDCGADGLYILPDGDDLNAYVRVQVWASALTPGPSSATVYLQGLFGNAVAMADITAAQATAGNIATTTLGLKNETTLPISDLRIWIDAAVSGIEIGLTAGPYYTPTAEDHVDVLIQAALAAGATQDLYVKRTIGAGADSDPAVLTELHCSWMGI
jgi:hypothetical protein